MLNTTSMIDKLKNDIYSILKAYNYLAIADVEELLLNKPDDFSEEQSDRLISTLQIVREANMNFYASLLDRI